MSQGLTQVTTQPTHTGIVTGTAQAPAQIGGQNARVGTGQTIARAIHRGFEAIRDAFVGLKDRITTHFANRAAAARQGNAEKAANKFAQAFAEGVPSENKALSLMATLMKSAAKLNPGNPAAQAHALLQQARTGLTGPQREAFDSQSWPDLGRRLGEAIDTRTEQAHHLMQALEDAGLGSGSPVPQNPPTSPLKGQVASLCGALHADHLTQVQANLPTGVQMDAHGNLGGTVTLANIPTDFQGALPQFRGQPIVDFFRAGKTDALQPQNLQDMNGLPVPGHVNGDFYRMDFDIPLPNGMHFQSSQDAETNPNARSQNALGALRQFCGNDQATTVLSSILGQTTLHPLARGAFSKPDGTQVHMKIATAQNTLGTQMTMKDAQGVPQPVDGIVGIGGARWNLSTEPNGDFRVSVDWPAYYTTDPNNPNDLPLHENGLVGVHYRMDFVVDHAQAANGVLSFNMPNGIQATFSGRVDV